MAMVLEGRVAVISGATAGIGEATAAALVEAGARVVINGRRQDRLDGLQARLGRERVRGVAGDAADAKVVLAMLDGAREAFGREADLVVVNAGRGLNGSVMTSDPAQWEEMVRLNVVGAAMLMREAGLRMIKAAEGKSGAAVLDRPRDIIAIGSAVGRHVSPFSSMYGGTKFAVHAMAEGVRRELGPKGVRVTLLAPGFVVSEFQGVAGYDPKWFDEVAARIGPVLRPEDVARVIVTIAGQPPHVHLSEVLMRPTRQDYP
jgi:NADP-dependent 3-hydroxy acid dehydrogenase YdfG